MSIVERVAQAEARAAEIRKEAQVKSLEKIAGANVAARQIAREAQDRAKQMQQDAMTEANKVGLAVMEEMKQKEKENTRALCAKARGRLDDAVTLILHEVAKA